MKAYKQVNQRLRDYITKINQTILEEGYILRKNTLKLMNIIQEERIRVKFIEK